MDDGEKVRMEVDMPLCGSLKPLIFSLEQYEKSPSETNLTKASQDLQGFIEIINNSSDDFAIVHQDDVMFRQLLNQIHNILTNSKIEANFMLKTLQLLSQMTPSQKSVSTTFQRLALPLSKYILCCVKAERFPCGNSKRLLAESVQLFEKISYDCDEAFSCCDVESLVKFCTNTIEDPILSVSSLGILSNMVQSNQQVRSQVKALMSGSQMKNLLRILASDSGAKKISVLSIMTRMSWDDPFVQKFFSVRNVHQVLVLVLSRATITDDFVTQQRASDLCVQLLTHDIIQQQLAVMESEGKCSYASSLLKAIKDESNMECISKVLEVVMRMCESYQLRACVASQMRNNPEALQVLYHLAHAPSSSTSWLAISILCRICEEGISCDVNDGSGSVESTSSSWFISILEVLSEQLIVDCSASTSQTPKQLTFAFKKSLKILTFFKELCNEVDLQNRIVEQIESKLPQLIDDQLKHNLIGVAPSNLPQWSELGVGVMVTSLRLLLIVKNHSLQLESKLHRTLQDSQITPFIASALASSNQSHVLSALQLVKETSHLPDFADVLLADRITNINKTNPSSTYFMDCDMDDKENIAALSSSSALSSARSSQVKSKDEIASLIAQINQVDHNGAGDSPEKMSDKTSHLVEMYENKLSMLAVKEKQLEELLDAKTSALQRADQLNALCRNQSLSNEANMKKLTHMLTLSQEENQKYEQRCSASHNLSELLKQDLQVALNENENLRKIADQYDLLQTSYQEKVHKVGVLERDLCSAREEHEKLIELRNLIQKHNDKMQGQQQELKTKLDASEEARMEVGKRCGELEATVGGMKRLCDNQQVANDKLREEKGGLEQAVVELRAKADKLHDELQKINSKLSICDASRQQAEHKLKELTMENRKINSKNDALKSKLSSLEEESKKTNTKNQEKMKQFEQMIKQLKAELKEKDGELKERETKLGKLNKKFEKQAKTLAMITQLSNDMQCSQ